MQFNLLAGTSAPLELYFFADPGHGWLAADLSHVRALGLTETISHYSYVSRDGKTIYLEEDMDMPRYVQACRSAGINVTWRERHGNTDSFIRRLDRYDTTPGSSQSSNDSLF